jgi:taurine dioxygenase
MKETTLKNRPSGKGTVKMRPASGTTGIEILDVDLREPLPEQSVSEILWALGMWGAVFFRNQDLTPEQQIAFAKQFGPVEGSTGPSNLGSVGGYPELNEIRRDPADARNPGGYWHADQCFKKEPPLGTILYARELPDRGGDTMFAHMGAVCEQLSDGLMASLRTMRAIHDRVLVYGRAGKYLPGITHEDYAALQVKYAGVVATQPVIVRHPETGQEILFINPVYTDRFEGWTREESHPLMHYLCDLATRPENICRFRWEEGSLAFWDNRTALHYAVDDYPGQARVMHRCVVRGSQLEPA